MPRATNQERRALAIVLLVLGVLTLGTGVYFMASRPPLLAGGVLYPPFGLLLTPMLATAATSLSSVLVITNALRLRRALR